MPVGAAIAGAAVVGGGASIYGANKAASTASKASTKAADLQLSMFNTTRDDLAPYRAAGGAALPAVYQLLGLQAPTVTTSTNAGSLGLSSQDLAQVRTDNPGIATEYQRASAAADKNSPAYAAAGLDSLDSYTKHWYDNIRNPNDYTLPTAAAAGGAAGGPLGGGGMAGAQAFLAQTPGYQFQQQQGMQAVENTLAARGLGGLSGSLGKGLARFVTGLADSTYQQQLGNYMGLANMGASAANQTGGYGTATAGNAGTNIANAGAASAAGTVGAVNGISGGANGIAQGYLTSKILGGMYDGAPAYPGAGYTPAVGDPVY